MSTRVAMGLGALFGGLAVAFGAFGAHSLRTRIDPEQMAVFETGVRYQMYHALALLASSRLISRGVKPAAAAAVAFTLGIVLFCGSLYLMALTGWTWLGPITPIGGVAFLLGWGMLFLAALKHP